LAPATSGTSLLLIDRVTFHLVEQPCRRLASGAVRGWRPLATSLLLRSRNVSSRATRVNMGQFASLISTFAPRLLPALGQVGSKRALRIFAFIYIIQAILGIATGVVYAVWLLYW
jgi:hypothetical protein